MRLARFVIAAVALLALVSCERRGADFGTPCRNCGVPPRNLASADVRRILAQAVTEASAQERCVQIAIVDRSGNVLAVYTMTKTAACAVPDETTLASGYPSHSGGLEDVEVPTWEVAIAKAVTGAYLSSSGNAFSTRTASFIIQENFPPGTRDQASGPLFGVQFSQLSCSDVMRSRLSIDAVGPQRSPLGLAGSPGGLPLYHDGVVVGGIGVAAKFGIAGIDRQGATKQEDLDERVAIAGASGFSPPASIRADHISLGPSTLPWTKGKATETDPEDADEAILATAGTLVDAPGFFAAIDGYRDGVAFGTTSSGILADTAAFADLDGFVLVDGAGANRYPPIAGASGLLATDVESILRHALETAVRTRGQIRHPVGSSAQVTIAVVDLAGDVLGIVRTPDAPVFGIDVSVQKARTATLFSRADASALLAAEARRRQSFSMRRGVQDYVSATDAFFGADPFDGTAFSSRTIGNLARPFYPDGIAGKPNGPLSKDFALWSPFDTGLQLDVSIAAILAGAVNPTSPAFSGQGCSKDPAVARNGLQIFPGGFPIYRDGVLAGGIGVSGDGTSQDDMIAFLGVHLAGADIAAISNASPSLRADTLTPHGSRLRFVACPAAPFLDSSAQ